MNTVTQNKVAKKLFTTRELVVIGLFSALSYVLMLLESPAYIGFLRIELSDIPAIIASIQFGPAAAVCIELIKNLVKALTATKTAGVGELANFVVSIAYVIPLGIFYRKLKGKYRILSFIAGILGMVVAGIIVNYFITIPLYAKLYGGEEVIVNLAKATLPGVNDVKSLILLGITPFNVVKGIIISIVGYITHQFLKNRL
jgi:riboflavin transporter FmnP